MPHLLNVTKKFSDWNWVIRDYLKFGIWILELNGWQYVVTQKKFESILSEYISKFLFPDFYLLMLMGVTLFEVF